MPKPYTCPFILDEVLSLDISNLRKWNYLKEDSIMSGTITWTNSYHEITSRLPINVVMQGNKHVNLNYKCNENSYNYNISLVTLPSNLGKGQVYYFLCPFTGKRCRKLHLIDEQFMHRSALRSALYSKQTHSKSWRFMERHYGAYFDEDKYYEELYSKHFKRYYNGKPTKRFLGLIKKINRAKRITPGEIERLLLN